MSMNLILEANCECILKLKSRDSVSKKIEKFKLWQTPTNITYKALRENPYEVYKEWVLSVTEEIDHEHIEELDSWLEQHKEWNIEWKMI